MINTIFYFPHDKADYNAALVYPGISSRTISFVPNEDGETGTIYKNGIVYSNINTNSSSYSDIEQYVQNAIQQAKDYSDNKINQTKTAINSSVDQKIQQAIVQLSTGTPIDYTINVQDSSTGIIISQPGTNKTFSVTIPGEDSRINNIISSQNDIINRLGNLDSIGSRLTTVETTITRLNNCCSSVQSVLDTLSNRMTVLENRVSTLETQASIQPEIHELNIATNTLTLGSSGGAFFIPTVTYDENTITLQESYISGLPVNPAWIHSFVNGAYVYDANPSSSPRYADLVITYQGLSKTLSITQPGAQQTIVHTLTIADNGSITVNHEQHLNYSIPTVLYDGTDVTSQIISSNLSNLPSWITPGSAGKINIASNNAPNTSRTATITITYNTTTASLIINQDEDTTVHVLNLSSYSTSVNAQSQSVSLPSVIYDGTQLQDLSNVQVSVTNGATYNNGVISLPENTTSVNKTYVVTITHQSLTKQFTITQHPHILSYDANGTVLTDSFTSRYNPGGGVSSDYYNGTLYYDGTLLQNGEYFNIQLSGDDSFIYWDGDYDPNQGVNSTFQSNKISFRCAPNWGVTRTTTLTFTYQGKSVTLTVTQNEDPDRDSFHDSGHGICEFRLNGDGNRGGNDPHPYLYEQYYQLGITERAAMNTVIELKSSDNSITYVTLNSVDINDPNYTSGDTQHGTDSAGIYDLQGREVGNYELSKRWSSSEGLVVGVHLKKWTEALDEYDDVYRIPKYNASIDGVTINAVPMKRLFEYIDNKGPREFNLVITDPDTGHSTTHTMIQYGSHGILFNYGRDNQGVHSISHRGFQHTGIAQNPGRFSQNCDQITNGTWTEGTDYFGKTSSSLALNNGNYTIEKINGSDFDSTDLVSSIDDNIIMVAHYNEGPDVITSTYYGDLTDASSIDWTNMTLMTRHCKSGHTPTTAKTGITQYTNYSTIGDASLRYTTDSDWQQS